MFIQKCFIQENNQLLRLRLEELGYEKSMLFEGDLPYLYTNICKEGELGPFYDEANFDAPILFHTNDSIINCKGNESLFLAIAALRDDTDEYQLFFHDEDIECENPFKCIFDEFNMFGIDFSTRQIKDSKDKWHKATVEELIKHFSKY